MAVEEVTRSLVVADWAIDARDVVAECRRRAERDAAVFILIVPAWLHGLDWAGDPRAAVPCAQRQPLTLARLCPSPDSASTPDSASRSRGSATRARSAPSATRSPPTRRPTFCSARAS